ncbi:Imm50 family immunity protein [Hymenobacter sp. B1770]|uniref:Imm50 family immunity protein n=1 Tax=Hymenobacter sp. B1770 TaxID=1718788 RepID=UPI003CE76808
MEADFIENGELVIQHFGYWPTFHDAEILSLCYERNYAEGCPTLVLKVYSFEMTNKRVGRYFKLIKHCLVEFELRGIFDNEMDGFNHQNAVNGISFRQENDLISCDIDPTFGIGATIVARQLIVKSLLPLAHDPKHSQT